MVSLACANCGFELTAPVAAPPLAVQCPLCSKQTELDFFPALLRETPRGTSGEALLIDSESSCFYHEGKKAVVVCDHCGRFLCGLCDVEFNGRHVCPGCVETMEGNGDPAPLQREVVYYDELALSVAIYPILIFYLIPITAPIVLYLVIRYWNKIRPLVPRSRWRFVVAGLVATLELGLIGLAIFGFMALR